MKRSYVKPMIIVETLSLDMPVAANCIADKEDMESLIELGYFLEVPTCKNPIPNNGIAVPGGHDTICYHSNVQTAFLS